MLEINTEKKGEDSLANISNKFDLCEFRNSLWSRVSDLAADKDIVLQTTLADIAACYLSKSIIASNDTRKSVELNVTSQKLVENFKKLTLHEAYQLTEALFAAIRLDSPSDAEVLRDQAMSQLSKKQEKAALGHKELITPVSGFLEYSPVIERERCNRIKAVIDLYESYGYQPVSTPTVERLEVLASKGEDVDKEIYVIDRIHSEPGTSQIRMGLRFDLTVPLARYVARHQNDIAFPFKRYQVQPCYRGERPQDGRFREFIQCDVDIIGSETLPFHADIEVAKVGFRAIENLGVKGFTFRMSNRKLIEGVLEEFGVTQKQAVCRLLDKQDKIGTEKTLAGLLGLGLEETTSLGLIDIFSIKASTAEQLQNSAIRNLNLNPLLKDGLAELSELLSHMSGIVSSNGKVLADLSVMRGLDYYTGSIFEATWEDFRNIGSLGAGGRYDNLTGQFAKKEFPGVGFSLGFSRTFDKLISSGKLKLGMKAPADVMIARLKNDGGELANKVADELRSSGLKVDVYIAEGKLDKQLRYASRLGIPFVLFDVDQQIKDMKSGEQFQYTAATIQLLKESLSQIEEDIST